MSEKLKTYSDNMRKIYERARIYALRHAGICGCDIDRQRSLVQRAYVMGALSAARAELELPPRLVLEKISHDEESTTIKVWR